MRTHAEKLEHFKAGYERQTRKLDPMGRERPWTSEELVELASVFRVEPFERRYPVVEANDAMCPLFCRVDLAGRNAAPVVGVYVDPLYECRKCSRRWLLMKT